MVINENFIDSHTTPFHSIGHNPKDFIVSSRVASQSILAFSENILEASNFFEAFCFGQMTLTSWDVTWQVLIKKIRCFRFNQVDVALYDTFIFFDHHLVHVSCLHCPTAIAVRLSSSGWWISSNHSFINSLWILRTTNIFILFNNSQGHLLLSSGGPILHSRQFVFHSIFDQLLWKARRFSLASRKSRVASGKVATHPIHIPQ